MTPPDEVFGGPQHAVGHAVDLGREGFGDDGDSHANVLAKPGMRPDKGIFRAGERLPPFPHTRVARSLAAAAIRANGLRRLRKTAQNTD
ncbi:hypothetical protein GCM10010195_54250 [Kitasatospora griseola]|nr:hypothetical protein GCM10010195_54250 [Kitasatospora griseola]